MELYKDNPNRIKILTHLFQYYACSFLDGLTLETNEDFIYLCDLNTYELYLISVADQKKVLETWGDYKGKKCYDVLQNRTSPCPFCTNHRLSRDQYYIWKSHNDVIDRDCILRDKLVEWENKLVRMEVVMDISNSARIDEVLRRSLDGQNLLSACMMVLIDTENIKEVAERLLSIITAFFGAEYGVLEYFDEDDTIIKWKENAKCCETYKHPPASRELVEQWGGLLDAGRQVFIRNQNHISQDDAFMSLMMERYGIESFCITPLFSGTRLMGLIGIENISTYWTELSVLNMIANHIAVRLRKEELQRENKQILYGDTTTGYLNFEGFKKRAEQILQDNPNKSYALWYTDFKNFKYINDVFGYEVGDRFLKQWADSIAGAMEEHETFGRIGGDRFAVLRCYEDKQELKLRFEQMRKMLDYLADCCETIHLELATGVYLMERYEDRLSLNEMMDRANIAQKHQKEMPGSSMTFYNEQMRIKVVRELELKGSFLEALAKEEFHLYLQPQVPLKDSQCWCAEALVRWVRSDGKIIAPGEFIGVFERDGIIPLLDRYMFEKTCRYIKEHEAAAEKPLRISVNVSRVTMQQPDFVKTYCRLKNFYGVADGCIGLEFTESVVVKNHVMFQEIVKGLKDGGFWCAMDDFGADQSSLNVLKDIPLDTLKLDGEFFDMEGDDGRSMAVVGCILQLASELHMETVAEGVESLTLVEHLRRMDCDYIQGYVYSKPIPAGEYLDFVRNRM